ncbi:MAG TPA: response regulator [Anaerolineales bacterium]|nr:response regulator [Anaerolineales bacterium]
MTKPFAFVVEDDPKLSEIISITLQEDFKLETCMDGDEALKRLKDITPQIVVLDLNLPGTAGADILKSIRADERLEKTRVILATADERQAETLTDDADIVLLKPVSPGQLREMALRMSAH